jgi:hypothetical protein
MIILQYLICLAISAVLSYFAVAFVEGKLNPYKWPKNERSSAMGLTLLFSILFSIAWAAASSQ